MHSHTGYEHGFYSELERMNESHPGADDHSTDSLVRNGATIFFFKVCHYEL